MCNNFRAAAQQNSLKARLFWRKRLAPATLPD
jgi:hypothetical protein